MKDSFELFMSHVFDEIIGSRAKSVADTICIGTDISTSVYLHCTICLSTFVSCMALLMVISGLMRQGSTGVRSTQTAGPFNYCGTTCFFSVCYSAFIAFAFAV